MTTPASASGSASAPAPGCDLCAAVRFTPWYHEDGVCWIAECEACSVPMVVWRSHGVDPPAADLDHMLASLEQVAVSVLGEDGYVIDRVMRQIPDHFHAHARRRWRGF